MDEIIIYINPPAGSSYDDRRGHLLLKNQLSFSVGLKDEGPTDELFPTENTPKDTTNGKQDNVEMLMMLVKNGISKNSLLLATLRKVAEMPKKLTFPDFLVGGGLTWLELTKNGSLPTGEVPNGCYVSALGTPKIIETYWTDGDYKEISGPVAFGSQVLLHIYTKDLYGQEVQIALTDRDVFDANDTVFKYRREVNIEELHPAAVGRKGLDGNVIKDSKSVTHVQKITLPIVVDLSWQFKAGPNLKLFPIVKSEKTEAFFKGFTRKFLSVQLGGNPIFDLESRGNIAVMVGKVETNIRAFDPCRYTHIKLDYDNQPPAVLFDQKKQINAAVHTIDIGVISNSYDTDEKKATITVKDVYTSECNNEPSLHEGVVIDITALEKAEIKPDYSEGTTTTLSFVPIFPYQFIDGKKTDFIPFFLEYFPAFNVKPALIELPVTTCAYQKQLDLRIYPDVAFAMHLQIGNPVDYTDQSKIYYRKVDLEGELVRGLKNEMDWVRETSKEAEIVTKYLPNSILNGIVQEIVYDYIENSANDLAAGFHGYRTFTAPDKATLINYSKEYEWIPKTIIIGGVVLSVVVDALILYLTRGRSAAVQGTSLVSKAKKAYKVYRKYKRYKNTATKIVNGQFIDPATPNGVETEFIWPQVSSIKGIGYVAQENGNVALELIERVDAAPLFALDHKITGSLGSIVSGFVGITTVFDVAEQAVGVVGMLRDLKDAKKDIEKATGSSPSQTSTTTVSSADEVTEETKGLNPADYLRFRDMQTFLDAVEKKIHAKIDKKFKDLFGTEAKVELDFIGFYSAHYEFRLNVFEKMMYLDIFDDNGKDYKLFGDKQVTFGRDYGIAIVLKFNANAVAEQKWSRLNAYIPDFLGVSLPDTKVDSEVMGMVEGSLNFERTFKWEFENKQPTVRDTMIFTGIAGSLYMKVKIEVEDDDVFEEELGSSNPDNKEEKKPISVELIPGFTINFEEQPIFEQSKWAYLMR